MLSMSSRSVGLVFLDLTKPDRTENTETPKFRFGRTLDHEADDVSFTILK